MPFWIQDELLKKCNKICDKVSQEKGFDCKPVR